MSWLWSQKKLTLLLLHSSHCSKNGTICHNLVCFYNHHNPTAKIGSFFFKTIFKLQQYILKDIWNHISIIYSMTFKKCQFISLFYHYFLCFCNLMLSKKNRKNDDPPSLSQILPGILSIGEYMAANLRARKKHGISQYVVKANVTSIFFQDLSNSYFPWRQLFGIFF